MTNKDLIKQYVDTGIQIPEYQFNQLNDNFKKTYLRKRIIATDNLISNNFERAGMLSTFLSYYEINQLPSEKQKEYKEIIDIVINDPEFFVEDKIYVNTFDQEQKLTYALNILQNEYVDFEPEQFKLLTQEQRLKYLIEKFKKKKKHAEKEFIVLLDPTQRNEYFKYINNFGKP
jgi:hypothetical protein